VSTGAKRVRLVANVSPYWGLPSGSSMTRALARGHASCPRHSIFKVAQQSGTAPGQRVFHLYQLTLFLLQRWSSQAEYVSTFSPGLEGEVAPFIGYPYNFV
jgi:hypothetical protein